MIKRSTKIYPVTLFDNTGVQCIEGTTRKWFFLTEVKKAYAVYPEDLTGLAQSYLKNGHFELPDKTPGSHRVLFIPEDQAMHSFCTCGDWHGVAERLGPSGLPRRAFMETDITLLIGINNHERHIRHVQRTRKTCMALAAKDGQRVG